jgi:hypothetical protein
MASHTDSANTLRLTAECESRTTINNISTCQQVDSQQLAAAAAAASLARAAPHQINSNNSLIACFTLDVIHTLSVMLHVGTARAALVAAPDQYDNIHHICASRAPVLSGTMYSSLVTWLMSYSPGLVPK